MSESKNVSKEARKTFITKGSCSHATMFILDKEFGFENKPGEIASDPLAGGMMQSGHQCGLLWGATLAVGSESFRRESNPGRATSLAIIAAQKLESSFKDTLGTVNCRELTGADFGKKIDMTKFMLKSFVYMFAEVIGTTVKGSCFNLAGQWAPKAIETAVEAMAEEKKDLPEQALSCSSEVARKMGATQEEIVTVAGFAGGIGLSGNACGALAAAIWMKTLKWSKANPGKTPSYFKNSDNKKILKDFYSETKSTMKCQDICSKKFNTIEEHSTFLRNGGCKKLIELLGNS